MYSHMVFCVLAAKQRACVYACVRGHADTATFFVYMAVLEGSGWQGGVDKLKEKFVTTFYNASVFW